MKSKYLQKTIIVSTILKRMGGENLGTYNDAIKDACKRYEVICYDAYSESGLDFENEFNENNMVTTKDGLHPNAAGAKLLGQRIAEFITSQAENN